ncbi:MAG TPA: hypothetical protein VEQ58_15075, partial [Polyangiaceae bacterium]|nr:hypothetical protein [Polyangiaceae bacterium]
MSRAALAEPSARAELTTLLDSRNVLNDAEPEPPLWESLGGLRSGRENRARLTLAGSDPGFWSGVSTSAALRLELGLAGLGEGRAATLRDASSALGVSWRGAAGLRISLAAYPFDTDYVRLGYLHALDWGGTQAANRESAFLSQTSGAPGLVLGLSTPRLQLFSGVKWAKIDDAAASSRLWGVFGGASFAFAPTLRADLGFGFFQRRLGALEGASLRVVWHRGVAEPEVTAEPFRPPSLRDDAALLEAEAPLGVALALEAVALVARPQQRAAAPAAALYGSARGRIFAGHAVLSFRSLAFVLRNDARFSTDDLAPQVAAQQAELAA